MTVDKKSTPASTHRRSSSFLSLRHPGSLLPVSVHNPRLLRLLSTRVTPQMIEYVARQTIKVIRIEGETVSERYSTMKGSSEASRASEKHQATLRVKFADTPASGSSVHQTEDPPAIPDAASLVTLERFISHIVQSSNVQVSTFLATLIYLDRLRNKLPPFAKGSHISLFPFHSHSHL